MICGKILRQTCRLTKLSSKNMNSLTYFGRQFHSANNITTLGSFTRNSKWFFGVGCVGVVSTLFAFHMKSYAKESDQNKKPDENTVQARQNGSSMNNASDSTANKGNAKNKCRLNMVIFSGNANIPLAEKVAEELGVKLGSIFITNSAISEIDIKVNDDIRGKDVYIIQSTCPPVNQNLFELMLMISTMRRGGARRITAVIPYYGYARQDRKLTSRVPISAADVARLIESMGVDRVVAVDLHCGQIQGFFGPRVPVDNLEGGFVGVDYFGEKDMSEMVIVSPDAGGVGRAKRFRDNLKKYGINADMAMIIKQRITAGEIGQMDLVGDVKDKHAIIVDDMIDTAGTLCNAAQQLRDHGAKSVYAFATHGLFSKNANSNITNSVLKEVVVLDTIPLNETTSNNEKIKSLTIAPLLASAIRALQYKKSVSNVFQGNEST